jgi:glycerol-3-phosphate acyltransferase PlsY
MMVAVAALVIAFSLGSLPWSLWVGKAYGMDLRQHGSGNLGATNVYRVMGWKWGVAVLLLDIAKGTAAVIFARALVSAPVEGAAALGAAGAAPGIAAGALPAAAGLLAVAGHMFTPFAGFRGGKGVATGLGIFIGLAPLTALCAFLVWVASMAFTGLVSVSSGIAAIFLPVFVVMTRDQLGPRYPWVLGLALLTTALVLVRHRVNWKRVAEGREQPIWDKRKENPRTGAEPSRDAAPSPGGER